MSKLVELLDLDIRHIDLSDFNKFLYETAIETNNGNKHQNCIYFEKTLEKFKKMYLRKYPWEVALWFKKFNFDLANILLEKHGYEFHIVISLFDGTPTYGMKYTGKCDIDCIYPSSSLRRKWRMDEVLACLGKQAKVGDMTEAELIKFLRKFSIIWSSEFGSSSDELSSYLDIRYLNVKLADLGIPYKFYYDDSTKINRVYRINKIEKKSV